MTVPSLGDAGAGRSPQHLAEPAPGRGLARRVGGWVLVVLGGLVGTVTSALTLALLFVRALGAELDGGDLWPGLLGLTAGISLAMLGFGLLGVRRLIAQALLGLLVVATGVVALYVVVVAIEVVQRAT